MSSIFLCSTLEKISLNEAVDFLMEIGKDDKRLDVYDNPRAKRYFLEKALLKNLHSQILVINENFIYDEFDQQSYDMSETEVDRYSFMVWAKDSGFNVPENLLKKTKKSEKFKENENIEEEKPIDRYERITFNRLKRLENDLPEILKMTVSAVIMAVNFKGKKVQFKKDFLRDFLRKEGYEDDHLDKVWKAIPDDLKNTGGNPRVAKK